MSPVNGAKLRILSTILLAALGGMAGILLRVPAGGIIGAVLAVGLVSVLTGRVPELSPSVRRNAQVLTGTVIGSGVGPGLVEHLGAYLPFAVLVSLWTIGGALLLGWWLHRRTGLDLATTLCCLTPGGLNEMILVAEELGGDGRLVGLVGLMRILGTVVLLPLLLGYLVLRR